MSAITFAESATPNTPSTGKAKIFVPTSSVPTIGVLDDAGVVGKIEFSSATTLTYTPPTTWTPGISFGGGTTGITYATQVGSYERIGKRILFSGFVGLSNKGSSTGTALITGLPVAARDLSNLYHPVSLRINALNTVTTHFVMGYVIFNTTTIALEYLAAGAVTTITDAIFQNTTSVLVSGSYEIA